MQVIIEVETKATIAMNHIAIQEQLDGRTADWMKRSATNNIGNRNSLKKNFLV